MIHRIVKMTFQEDKTEAFQEMVKQIHGTISGFEGCRKVNILNDTANPNIFFSYSLWEDERYLENYRQSEFFRKVWRKTKSLFADKPEAWSTEVFI